MGCKMRLMKNIDNQIPAQHALVDDVSQLFDGAIAEPQVDDHFRDGCSLQIVDLEHIRSGVEIEHEFFNLGADERQVDTDLRANAMNWLRRRRWGVKWMVT